MLTDNKLSIAVFDFDNTLINKNTLFDFFYSTFSFRKFISCLIYLSPSVFKYLIGIIPNNTLKEKMLTFYLKGIPENYFNKLCVAYKERLSKIVNTEALKRLLWHKKQNHCILIISASPEDWILPWAEQYTNEVLATKLNKKNGILTGELLGKNCYGPEKVKRLFEKYPDRSKYTLYVYGDGASDNDILKIADYPFKGTFKEVEVV